MNVLLSTLCLAVLQADVRHADEREDKERYENTIDQTYPIEDGARVEVHHSMGKVNLTSWKGEDVRVVARVHAEGERAKEVGPEIKIEVSPSGHPFQVRTHYPNISWRGISYGVELSIQVPARHSVRVEDSFGSVSITGVNEKVEARVSNGHLSVRETNGELELRSSFGDIEVKECSGRARVSANNGKIEITELAGEGLEVENHFGPIKILRSEGELRIHSSNGDVFVRESEGSVEARVTFAKANFELIRGDLEFRGQNVQARARGIEGEVSIENSFGELRLEGLARGARVVSANSPVLIRDVKGALEARCTFGGVEIERIGASCLVSNTNGAVTVRDIAGRLDLESSFGSVEIRGVGGDVTARTHNGNLRLDGINTQRGKNVDLGTKFGVLTISLPNPPSVELDAATTFGTINSEYDLKSLVKRTNKQSCKEKLGEGAMSLRLRSQNGDIRILRGAREKKKADVH